MMDSEYDIVVIGSGLGGLTCGYILARNGYKVAILEQGSQIGGCLQTFARRGVKFETGVHYIGSMNSGEVLDTFFNYFSLFPGIEVSPLDADGFDVISFCGERFNYASGHENFIDTLSQQFPAERDNIAQYVRRISDIARSSPFISLDATSGGYAGLAGAIPDYESTGAAEFIASATDNITLRNVLAGTVPLYAGIEDKTPLYIHALINDSNLSGACRIVGGSDQIALSLARSIQRFGGGVFTSSRVVHIDCDSRGARGVTLADGTRVGARYVISGAHPQRTLDMISSPLIRPVYRQRICNLDHSISNFTVYLRFRENAVRYMNHNFYHYTTPNVWGGENYSEADWPHNYIYLHLCPPERSGYARAAEIVSYMRFDETARWAALPIGHRGEGYEEFKRRKAEKLLSLVEEQFPGTLAGVESYYTSSPLTYLDYTGTKQGSMYGVLRDKNDPVRSRISHRTKIPNLLLTGQNINAHGILGVIVGSLITCSDLVGGEYLMRQIAGKL